MGTKHSSIAWFAAALLGTVSASATPPEYKTIGRVQQTSVSLDEDEVLRIWIVYVGQGDGILVQLPERSSRKRPDGTRERVDVLVDAGAQPGPDTGRMRDFIRELYSGDSLQIEHAIITHHDQDHFLGMTAILESTDVAIERFYHNGLASFGPGARGLPTSGRPTQPSVLDFDSGKNAIKRALGLLDAQGQLTTAFAMDDLTELRQAQTGRELVGDYERFAAAVIAKTSPRRVQSFERVRFGHALINPVEAIASPPGLRELEFEVLWPAPELRKFGDGWGETINGNSVTFRLRYRDFEMLFSGDHNEHSEQAMLRHLTQHDGLDKLRADVLKVPHHGSQHGVEAFFRAVDPAISVASQGPKGARSKQMSHGAWEHPSPTVIDWLGGAHRVYLTELHERRFDWQTVDSAAKLEALRERTHVLIETNGHWFRVVELPAPERADDAVVLQVPTVKSTKRGDGTRWIRAR